MTTRRDRERMIAEGTTTVDAELAAVENNMAQAIRERDEARRMYCGRVSRDVQPDAFDIAKNHGWDCFPQEDEPCQ